MQHPAVPELAHTTARPIHWLATAAALAAVVAGSAVLQPDAATAAQTGTKTHTRAAAGAPAPAPDPAAVDFPIDCGPVPSEVKKRATGDLDGDGKPETVAVVHCKAGSGTPPDGVYVITGSGSGSGTPRVVATLVDPKDRQNVSDFAVRDGAITATLLGYSSPDVPRCCPDKQDKAKWRWKDGTFERDTPDRARSV
ncbi:hypothetical protein ABZ953_35570 [Streptomyces sp. NPDC046465]|uniref:hypothetical protein n=1 Tax=Streptomyces sp. NPDC046465 TaxID=3155810 RepID=UPI0033C015ED